MSGKLVVFEGIDGTGKGDMVARATEWCKERFGPDRVTFSKDPGTTSLGCKVRDMLFFDPTTKAMAPGVCDLLFLASHMQNWYQIVEPALRDGKVVVSDRWWYSQMAYMAHRRVPDKIAEAYWSCKGPPADLLLVLTCDVNEALARISKRKEQHQRGKAWDDRDSLTRIQESYFIMFSERPEFRAVCTTGKFQDAVWEETRAVLEDYFK